MCGKKPPPPPEGPSADTAATVEVLEAGRDPKVKLEVGRWTGLVYRLQSKSDGSFGVVGQVPTKTPTSILESRFEVLRGTADPVEKMVGTRSLRLVEERGTLERIEVESSTLPADVVAKLNAAFGLLRGLTTHWLTAEDGEVVEVTTESVGGVKPPPEVKQLLDTALDAQRHFPYRLPSAPVGTGARWHFTEPLDVRGVKATQVADLTLLTLAKDTARISIRARHQAAKQQVPHPTEPGLTATLDTLRGDSDGELLIDRMTSCVLQARLTATSQLALTWMDSEGKDQHATFVQAQVTRMTGRIGDDADAGDKDAGTLDAGVGAPAAFGPEQEAGGGGG